MLRAAAAAAAGSHPRLDLSVSAGRFYDFGIREDRMRCPFCRTDNDRVIDSRAGDDGASIRRRRECVSCRRRFTTYERVERQLLSVVKKGGVREPFDRDKIKRGLAKACWKRPVTEDDIEGVVSALESELYGAYESEVPSQVLGERLMELLKALDQVAYVRFASVYREFKDVRDFVEELEPILAETTVQERT
jgi:transcriptional repressor NrdR